MIYAVEIIRPSLYLALFSSYIYIFSIERRQVEVEVEERGVPNTENDTNSSIMRGMETQFARIHR